MLNNLTFLLFVIIMKEFWDARYANNDHAYGRKPNDFVREQLLKLKSGTVLFPAEGQGRNVVFAAKLGWEVHAFDYSMVGKSNADKWAAINAVSINYWVEPIESYEINKMQYDVIVLCYVHLKPLQRADFYKKLLQDLRPNGHLIMEAFTKTQLAYQSGGPKVEALLYHGDVVKEDFKTLETILLEERLEDLDEGKFHQGDAHIIRYVGRKSVI